MFKDEVVGILFGKRLDPDNQEQIIVAAYYIGVEEEREKQRRTNEIWSLLR